MAHNALPETSLVEIYVGENLAAMDDDTVRGAFALFAAKLSELQ